MKRVKLFRHGLLVWTLAVAGFAVPARAQTGGGWTAYLGCWAATGDPRNVLCFTNESAGTVNLETVIDGEVVSTEMLVADGRTRAVDIEQCTGSKTVEFSAGARRVYTRSALACPDGSREGSGIMSFVSPVRWVDVRSLSIDGEEAVWIEEYEPVPLEWFLERGIANPGARDFTAVRSRRILSARPIGNDDVREALGTVDPATVQMWVSVQPAAFDLDGRALVDLADSGVPESVIDFMVARSFPERFRLDVGADRTVAEIAPPAAPSVPYSTFYRPRSYFFDPFYYYPGFYGYTWLDIYGYSTYPFGTYRPRPVYPYVPGGVIIVDGGGGEETSDRGGRIVNGRGYQPPARGASVAPGSNSPNSSAPATPASPVTVTPSGTVPAPGDSSPATPTGRQARPR